MKQITTASGFSAKVKYLVAALILTLMVVSLLSRSEKTATAETPQKFQAARWSPDSTVFAAQRGNPWINVRDGSEILIDFAGESELRASFESNESSSLSLAAADFDEDGMPDIVTGYKINNRGAALFIRGNIDAVYPNAPEAIERKAGGEFTDASFLSPALVFSLPTTPDFLAAGDFDADGHFDIAAASRTENAVYFLRGDGRGAFVLSKRIDLAGNVTAFLADDFNRRDGLNDLIVAVQTTKNAQLLIFENPYGAMRAEPEIFTFDAPVKALAVNLIEGDARFDLAIAAGNELAILRGRDRKLLFDESGKKAESVKLTSRKFDFQIDSLAVGDFIKGETIKNEIALLAADGKIHLLENGGTLNAARNLSAVWRAGRTVSLPTDSAGENKPVMLTARVSARSADTLVIGLGEQIHLLTSDVLPPKSETEAINYDAQNFKLAASLHVASRPTAILPMRLNIDALSDLVVMREKSVAPSVVQTAPMSTFTVDSNASVEDPRLSDGICAIPPCPPDGNLPCSGPCTYWAARQQASFNSGSSLINFGAPSNSFLTPQIGIITPLTIDGTTQGGGFVVFTGVFNQFPASHRSGNAIDSCVIRGIVANGYVDNYYINFGGSNSIAEGNRLGTNVAGTAVAPNNGYGVAAGFSNTLIGGTTVPARNIISTGMGGDGVLISSFGSGGTNRVQGNFIGTDVTGTIALGNRGFGIQTAGENILVGGTTAGAGNVVAGTTGTLPSFVGAGINPTGGIGVLVQGNRVGTNLSGTAALPNTGSGIYLTSNGTFDTIGGTVPTARNIISGNGGDGLDIGPAGLTPDMNILGNFIGTNAAGSAAIPNSGFGLKISQQNQNLLIDRNVISGNLGGGLQFCCKNGTATSVISNNLIGTNATGANALGNNGIGLSISSGGTGGFTRDATFTGNTIAANTDHGIFSDNSASLIFQNNFIGTNSSLSQTMGNGGDGMRVIGAFRSSQIGGAGAGNTIAFNAGNGINLALQDISSTENRISNNSIFSNGGLGIDLGGDGVTANDECDGENGVNTLQNYPVISAVSLSGAGNVRIVGRLNTAANLTYVLSFYANQMADASGFGEGQQLIGTTNVSVPAGCKANFSVTLPRTLAAARCISATATDPDGNTSEFSSCAAIKTATSDYDSDGLADLTVWRPSNGTWYTLQSSNGAFSAVQFGQNGDRPAPGDFDGNGRMDFTVYRNGVWFTLLNPNANVSISAFGLSNDNPIPGDYNGDGQDDLVVWRPSNGTWYILPSNGLFTSVQWGSSGDRPVSGDFDGDGRADLAIYRDGTWWVSNSRNNAAAVFSFGLAGDRPVPADYDGDGKTDIAVFRPSTGVWYYLRSGDGNSFAAIQWGTNGDTPVPADYDGDGLDDPAIYRNGVWWILRSSDGSVVTVGFGLATDIPIPAANQY